MNQIYQASPSKPEANAGPVAGFRVALVSSRWHRDIVPNATAAIRTELVRTLGRTCDPPGVVDHYEVPGAFEIPLHAKRLAAFGAYDAIIACGLVVNGGIYRHEFGANRRSGVGHDVAMPAR
ncbi:MAG: 6,7-dimethyl-8-ribityllumazine synthase [Rubrivivax sp.]